MKKLLSLYFCAFDCLLTDELFSFYCIISVTLSQIASMWANEFSGAPLFTVLLSITAVGFIITYFFKDNFEMETLGTIATVVFVLWVIASLTIGSIDFGFKKTFLKHSLPFIYCIGISFSRLILDLPNNYDLNSVGETLLNVFYIISQLALLSLPIVLFVKHLLLIPIFFELKVILIILSIILLPLLSLLEDNISISNPLYLP